MKFDKIMQIENLNYYHTPKNGISDISFEIFEKDCIALIGENGSGKTTLIKSILGILNREPQQSVSIIDNLSFKDIGYSSQSQSIDWYLNVFDNVMLGVLFGKKYLKSNTERKKLVDKALEITDLSNKSYENPNNLSGGQLQRVQIARAIVNKPRLLFLDEPTVGLDPILSEGILEYLKIHAEENNAVIVSSHDLGLLEKYCNKVLYLENGLLKFFGSMSDFIENSQNIKKTTIEYTHIFNENVFNQLKKLGYSVEEKNPLIIKYTDEKELKNILQLTTQSLEIKSINTQKSSLREIFIKNSKERGGL